MLYQKLERKIHVIPNKLVWLYVQSHTFVEEKNDASITSYSSAAIHTCSCDIDKQFYTETEKRFDKLFSTSLNISSKVMQNHHLCCQCNKENTLCSNTHIYIYTRTVKLTKCLSEAAPECLPLSIVEQIGPLHLSHQQPEHTHTYTQQACL